MDQHGNAIAEEGNDRCFCGCKYWENDRCVDCHSTIEEVRRYRQDMQDTLTALGFSGIKA